MTQVELDAFLAKFDNNGNRQWATYYGGKSDDYGYGITADANGNVYFTGYTLSGSSFPTTNDAFQSGINAYSNGFIVEFDGNGNREWATQFGVDHSTAINVEETSSYGITIDNYGNIIITGATECYASEFPITPGAFQIKNYASPNPTAYIAKFCTMEVASGFTADSICLGDTAQIGNVTISGGLPPYKYSWSPGYSLSDSTSPSPLAFPDTTTMYYVIINDAGGCSVFDSAFVYVRPMPQADAGGDKNVCEGNGTIIGFPATGGTPPYSYFWAPSIGLDTDTIATPYAHPSTKTQYIVTVTDKYGCQSKDTMVFTPVPSPVLATGGPYALCPGDTVTIEDTITDGALPYHYSWSPFYGLSSPYIQSPKAFPDSTTKYYLTVSDANGCSGYDSVTVKVYPAVLVSMGNDTNQMICAGDTVTIAAKVSGGKPPFEYRWNPSIGLSNVNDSMTLASPNSTTRYTVIVTDSNGCQASGQTIVSVYPYPALAIIGPEHVCINSTDSYTVQDSIADTASSYSWRVSTGGTIVSGQGTSTIAVQWGGAGTYIVSVTETNTHGCTDSTRISVIVSSSLKPQIAASGYSLCGGDSVTLDAGQGYASYLWSTGATSETIIVTKAGRILGESKRRNGLFRYGYRADNKFSAARASNHRRYGGVQKIFHTI